MLRNTNNNTLKSRLITLLWVLFLFYGKIFGQTTWYVNDSYNAATDIYCSAAGSATATSATASLTVSGLATHPVNSLTTAIGWASNGDIILVDAGTYNDVSSTGHIFNLNVGVTVQGAGIGITTFTPIVTNSYAFMTVTSQSVTLQDFSIAGYGADAAASGNSEGLSFTTSTVTLNAVLITSSGGSGSYHAAIYLNKSIATINEGGVGCTFGSSTGGGIEVAGSSTVSISNFMFYKNKKFGGESVSTGGCALSVTGGTVSNASVTVTNCNFTANSYTSVASDFYGGAIYISGGVVNISNSQFSSNVINNGADNSYGGAIAIDGSSSTSSVTISSCLIQNNHAYGTADNYGGAIAVVGASSSSTVAITSCTFSNNAVNDGVDGRGNDIYSNLTNTVTITACSFTATNNSSLFSDNGTIKLSTSGKPSFDGNGSGTVVYSSTTTSTPTLPTVVTATACATTGSNFILPIVLTEFMGQCTNNQTTLVWQTATQINNRVFDVEKSLDGSNFSVIGTVKGAGNSTETLNYAFVDKNAKEGIAYYRLTQVDYNGKSSQSNIITVNSCAPAIAPKINLYPNPAADNFNVAFTLFQTSQVTIDILNELGQVVKSIPTQSLESGIQTLTIDASNLSGGVYFLKVGIDNNPETIHKLIKL